MLRNVPIEWFSPCSISDYENDPDLDPDEIDQNIARYDRVERAIQSRGTWPIIVSGGFILDGNHRLAWLADNGADQVDVLWTPKTARIGEQMVHSILENGESAKAFLIRTQDHGLRAQLLSQGWALTASRTGYRQFSYGPLLVQRHRPVALTLDVYPCAINTRLSEPKLTGTFAVTLYPSIPLPSIEAKAIRTSQLLPTLNAFTARQVTSPPNAENELPTLHQFMLDWNWLYRQIKMRAE